MRPFLLVTFAGAALGVAAFVAACSSATDDDASNRPADTAAAPAPAPAAPAPAASPLPGTGKVLETMNAGAYTYVRVDLGGRDVWAAGPQVAVQAGETVSLPAGMPMTDYHSKTLDRTFPLVYFVGEIRTAGAAAAPPAHGAAPAGHGSAAPAAPAAPAEPVARVEGGQTVEEIVTKSADFAGKDVAVRGRVVKFNAGIMGSNWIHIQDGTGAAGTNDLTVTTDATVKVGDVVLVRGKVTTDKDFGAGYKYAVIVEKAAVEKQ